VIALQEEHVWERFEAPSLLFPGDSRMLYRDNSWDRRNSSRYASIHSPYTSDPIPWEEVMAKRSEFRFSITEITLASG
jgi:hypothetical protein